MVVFYGLSGVAPNDAYDTVVAVADGSIAITAVATRLARWHVGGRSDVESSG